MNRRTFLTSSALVAAFVPAGILCAQTPDSTHAVDFLRREFADLTTRDGDDDPRVFQASAWEFSSTDVIGGVIETLIADSRDAGGFEISIGAATPVASPVAGDSVVEWFVTYTTWAGVAAYRSEHAEAIFTIGTRVFSFQTGGHDPDVLVELLSEQIELLRSKTGSLAEVLPSDEDLPGELELYREYTPEGVSDGDGNPTLYPDPAWRNPLG